MEPLCHYPFRSNYQTSHKSFLISLMSWPHYKDTTQFHHNTIKMVFSFYLIKWELNNNVQMQQKVNTIQESVLNLIVWQVPWYCKPSSFTRHLIALNVYTAHTEPNNKMLLFLTVAPQNTLSYDYSRPPPLILRYI